MWTFTSFKFVWIFPLFSVAYTYEDSTVVNLPKLGSIQGRVVETAWTKREVYQFVDIKYAESPSGERRFKPPTPIGPWEDTYDATTEKMGCPSALTLSSIDEEEDHGNDADMEDCLTLTITTPNITGKYPVLVYIHGEYLYEGSNSEAPPDYLLEKDIVLVVPQYRLGPFGFLSTKTEEIPGNAGVMDVFLALQFVRIFISNFGGDPTRITLAGQVGGAAIAHVLTLSPMVEPGLFHQVIYHSGSAMMPVFLDDDPRKHAQDIAIRSGCKMRIVRDLNECLMGLSAKQLLLGFMEHAQEGSRNGTGSSGGAQFTIGGPSPVLPVHPSMLMAAVSNFTYPAMGGCPRNVGTRLLSEILENHFGGKVPDADEYNTFDYINHVMRQVIGWDSNMLLTSFVTHDFFNRMLVENGTFHDLIPRLVDMAGTLLHKLPVLLALNMNGKHLPDNTFLYSFDYRGEFNRYPELDEETNYQSPFKAGVSLTDEMLYLFPYPEHVKSLSPTDKIIAKLMVELWTSFVINGNPMASNRGGYWPPMTTLYGPYLKIDETLTIAGNYFKEFSATENDEELGKKLIREAYYKHKKTSILV